MLCQVGGRDPESIVGSTSGEREAKRRELPPNWGPQHEIGRVHSINTPDPWVAVAFPPEEEEGNSVGAPSPAVKRGGRNLQQQHRSERHGEQVELSLAYNRTWSISFCSP